MRRRPVAVLLLLAFASVGTAAERQLTVFAAASMTDVLQQIGRQFTADRGIAVRFSFAASSALARQIESGAPADVFVSADQDWMGYLQAHRQIDPRTRRDVVSNALVLIAPADGTTRLQ